MQTPWLRSGNWALAIVLGIFVLLGCGSLPRANEKPMAGGDGAPAPSVEIEKQAETEAVRALGAHLTKCGDSYVGKLVERRYPSVPGYYEYRSFTSKVKVEQTLSEADKLNGIDWAARVTLTPKAYRAFHDHDPKWTDWRDVGMHDFKVRVSRANGQWKTDLHDDHKPVACADIPK